MANAVLSIEGIPDLRNRINSMGSEAKKVAVSALESGAAIIKPRIEALTPVSGRAHTGNVKASGRLKESYTIQKKQASLSVGIMPEGGANGQYFYWKYPEYGVGTNKKAQGFIQRGVQETGNDALNMAVSIIKQKLGLS